MSVLKPGEKIQVFLQVTTDDEGMAADQIVGWIGVVVDTDAAALRFSPTFECLDDGRIQPIEPPADDHVVAWSRIALLTVDRSDEKAGTE